MENNRSISLEIISNIENHTAICLKNLKLVL